MYDIVWDPDTGGIILTDNSLESIKREIRPVFYEELDLLGFNKHWTYPKSQEPLLWATSVGRRYFYSGELVAEAKGGSFFEAPEIIFFSKKLDLEPVNMTAMLEKNATLMKGLAHEAIVFIKDTQEQMRKKADVACVAFSGGKDSLVLLDLVQRALRPDEFVVVFSDTTMEITPTLTAVNRAKERWNHLQFYTARSEKDAKTTWREFGPPSRIHRWCCAVHKSAPTILLLRDITNKPALKALVYDGIRREESRVRAGYKRITRGSKHNTQINISPLLHWNAGEIFLYLFDRDILFNEAYRYGFVRVGCSVCPLASKWWESISSLAFKSDCNGLLDVLFEYAGRCNRKNVREKKEFIGSGGWKGRAGGRYLSNGGYKVLETVGADSLTFLIRHPRENWQEWLKTLGDIAQTGPNSGEVTYSSHTCIYSVKKHSDAVEVSVRGIKNADRYLISYLRSISQKSAYCVHCKACEVECPVGALKVMDHVQIDETVCIHCQKCISFSEKGCLAAKSLGVSKEGSQVKGINRYQHFGMRKEWLEEYFKDPETWWHENSLGNRQFEAIRVWLRESEITEKNEITALGKKLQELGADNPLTWYVIWTNLVRNSVLVRWYIANIEWGSSYTKKELIDMVEDTLSRTTRQNAVTSLVCLLRDTPLGSELELGIIRPAKGRTVSITKTGLGKDTNSIAVLYSLYRYAEKIKRYNISVEELYSVADEGPYRLFGLSTEVLKQILRGLSSRFKDYVSVEFVRDLDNIYLSQNHIASEVLNVESGN